MILQKKQPIIQKSKGCQYFGDPFTSVGKSTAVNNLTTVPKSTLVKTGVSKIGQSTRQSWRITKQPKAILHWANF